MSQAGLALQHLLQVSVIGYLSLGVIITLGLAMVPGITGSVVAALLLPLLFHMSVYPALAMFVASQAVVLSGASVAAILFGASGAAPAMASAIDGYRMTRQGKASEALGISVTATATGGLVGAVVLAIAIPIMRPLVKSVGPPEFFVLALAGLMSMGLLTGRNRLKGVIAGLFGLMLSTVGQSLTTGTPRYTFGLLVLFNGIPLVPLLIGVFAISGMMRLMITGEPADASAQEDQEERQSEILPRRLFQYKDIIKGVKEVLLYRLRLLLSCSVLGTLIGMMPGLGGDAATFLTYAYASRRSPEKEMFGRGAVDGVLAPEAAGNAKEGGALIPTLAFGIPNSGAMVVLMAALTIVGLSPGPSMLTRHLSIVWFIVFTLVLANIMASLIIFAISGLLVRVTELPGSLVAPIVISVSLVGAYLASTNMVAVITALGFGVVGYWMRRNDWSAVPLVMGLVLGGLVERDLLLSDQLYGLAFMIQPGVLVLFGIGTLVVVFSYLKGRWQSQRAKPCKPAEIDSVRVDREGNGHAGHANTEVILRSGDKEQMRGDSIDVTRSDLVMRIVIVLVSGFWCIDAFSFPVVDRIAPLAYGIPCFIASGWALALAIRSGRLWPGRRSGRTVAPVMGLISAFAAVVWIMGFYVSIVLFVAACIGLQGRRPWWSAICIGLSASGVIAILVSVLLHQSLYGGIFGL